jgi:hypothetical protein
MNARHAAARQADCEAEASSRRERLSRAHPDLLSLYAEWRENHEKMWAEPHVPPFVSEEEDERLDAEMDEMTTHEASLIRAIAELRPTTIAELAAKATASHAIYEFEGVPDSDAYETAIEVTMKEAADFLGCPDPVTARRAASLRKAIASGRTGRIDKTHDTLVAHTPANVAGLVEKARAILESPIHLSADEGDALLRDILALGGPRVETR